MPSKIGQIKCDNCDREHSAQAELFKLCKECDAKICFRCWQGKENNEIITCPKCGGELRTPSESEIFRLSLVNSVKDNPRVLRGQTMHIESACIPRMMSESELREMRKRREHEESLPEKKLQELNDKFKELMDKLRKSDDDTKKQE